ncbi:MAG: NADH-quinone oxidoreductase subunit NuoG [Candidatus Lightella neohaematopini]|nr:NADH-quinone oxidoreductase subunit NuoG [Candidatus Lightella neohaematopini]
MIIINIDGNYYSVSENNNLLHICLSLGFNIPYFCWHPALGSIGVCRQCAVKKYNNQHDNIGSIVMSCMTTIDKNMIISTNHRDIINFRKNITELMMTNHPHDCPICEEAGDCHLQNMTILNKHFIRRYRFSKRIYKNQYLGPFINHHMNRCIGCYRCVRFYCNYSGGSDFGVYGSGNNIYFGRVNDGVLENRFSGNLVEVCPTGVFTNRIYSKVYVRKWDINLTPSICLKCSIGCNINIGTYLGSLRYIENRYHSDINGFFLCDLGRFGYSLNKSYFIRYPIYRNINRISSINIKDTIKIVANLMKNSKRIIGLGSPRASMENNFALSKLVGTNNFYLGISQNEYELISLILQILNNSGIYIPSLLEIENYDAILVLGENISETGARMALSVRQAVNNISNITSKINIKNWHSDAIKNYTQERKNLLFITNVDVTNLDDIATWCYYASLDDQARFGFTLANIIDNTAPKVINTNDKLVKKIHDIAYSLIHANKVLIISGTTTNKNVIKAAANIAIALKNKKINVGINFITNYANSLGLSLIKNQGSIEQALNLLKHKIADGLIILENDLYRYVLKNRLDNSLNNINTIIILDYKYNNIMKKANIIIPTTSSIESSGTVINYEGRIQRFFKPYDKYLDNKNYLLDSWYWLHTINSKYLNTQIKWKNINDVTKSLTKHISKLSNINIINTNNNNSKKQESFTNIPRNCGYNALNNNLCAKKSKCFFTDEEFFNKQKNINNYEIKYNDINVSILGNEYYNYVNTNVKIFNKKIGDMHYFNYINNNKESGKWLIVPYWNMFGSEETSQKVKVIKQVTSSVCIIISYEDAKVLSIKNNSLVTFTCMGNNFTLPVKLSDKLCSGHIGLPIGLPGIPTCLSGLTVNNIRE